MADKSLKEMNFMALKMENQEKF